VEDRGPGEAAFFLFYSKRLRAQRALILAPQALPRRSAPRRGAPRSGAKRRRRRLSGGRSAKALFVPAILHLWLTGI